jgi:hypothetical protein
MDITQENKLKIQANRREIFELESLVNANRSLVYSTRAAIEQNYTSIMRNYSSAFLGNHQITTQNTDNIFRNRLTILNNMEVDGDVEENFRESMTNSAKLDFLEMQASVNKLVLEINNRMTEVNSMLIETNKMIMSANEKSVKFNKKNLAMNKEFIEGEFITSGATPLENKKRVEENKNRCKKIRDTAEKNSLKLDSLYQKAKKNSMDVLLNSAEISKRREVINEGQSAIIEDQNDVARIISRKLGK